MFALKKASGKVLEMILIFAVQLIVGWLITKVFFKWEWDLAAFAADPGMIAFWAVYLIGSSILVLIGRRQKSKRGGGAE